MMVLVIGEIDTAVMIITHSYAMITNLREQKTDINKRFVSVSTGASSSKQYHKHADMRFCMGHGRPGQ